MIDYENGIDALADRTRRRILEQLRERPRSVNEIVTLLPISQPAVSQHLRVLREAGLVSSKRDGKRRLYSIDTAGLTPIRAYLDSFWNDALEAFADEANRQARGGTHE